MTTIETVTAEQIKDLRSEALASDPQRVALARCCVAALETLPQLRRGLDRRASNGFRGSYALAKCVDAINADEAQQ